MPIQKILIAGQWRDSLGRETFQAVNPTTKDTLADEYPVSPWAEVEEAIDSAAGAFRTVRTWAGRAIRGFPRHVCRPY